MSLISVNSDFSYVDGKHQAFLRSIDRAVKYITTKYSYLRSLVLGLSGRFCDVISLPILSEFVNVETLFQLKPWNGISVHDESTNYGRLVYLKFCT